MNGNCQTCPVESQCAYPYKPTDCCDQRKFRPITDARTGSHPMPNDREAFEAHAAPMGFDLTRQDIAVPEPWAEYVDQQTGYFWAGWQAGAAAENERLARKAENMTDGWHSLTPEEIRDRGIT